MKRLLTANVEELKALEPPKDEAEEKLTRLANQYMMLAFTSQLQSATGLDITYFSYRRPPRRLRAHEQRFFLDWPEWPAAEECPRRRSCIEDTVSGNTWYELPLTVSQGFWQRPALHLVVDQCSKGWHMAQWLYVGPPALRGVPFLDRLHTVLNILGDCESDAGISMLRYEWSTALNAFRGPWKSHKHANTLKCAGEELWKHSTPQEEVFEVLYEGIAADLGMLGPTLGSAAHKAQVHAEARRRFLAQSFGAESSRERWWTTEAAYSNARSLININLYALLYWGGKTKRWKSLRGCPLTARLGAAFDDPGEAEEGDGGGDGANEEDDAEQEAPEAGVAADTGVCVRVSRNQAKKFVAEKKKTPRSCSLSPRRSSRTPWAAGRWKPSFA